MAAEKKVSKKRAPSSGSDPKSKRIVASKMEATMAEFKKHELTSGRSGKKVSDPKQAKAIALSEARRGGADIPDSPNAGKRQKKS